ncbi:hypothetical protein ACWGOQ_0021210 [Aquimarina sp. M1]
MIKIKRIFFRNQVAFITVFLINIVLCYGTPDSILDTDNRNSEVSKKDSKPKTEETLPAKTFRKFKSLEKFNTPVRKPKSVAATVEEGFDFITIDSLQNRKWLEMAEETFAKIEETQNYIDQLTSDKLSQLPVAISPKTISSTKYTVGIAKAVFTPSVAELTVFLKVETARGILILGAEDIKLSHDGGIVGDATLNLISKFNININQGKILLSLNGSFNDRKTYATIDCDGFKELGIDADVIFSSDLIFPVNEDGKKIDAKQVTASVKTTIADWNDWVVNISLPEFGVKGLEGTTFRLNTAVLDFSDLRNDDAVPADYINTYYSNNPTLWRGVYVESLQVVLPKAFKKNNSTKRVAFTGTKMIIDDAGVTGSFEGNSVLSIDEGSASKWQFSLDYFKIELQRNTLIDGEFNGEMVLPVSKVGRIQYSAFIQPDEYTFQVSKTEGLSFDVWNANVDLTPDSYIEMKIEDDVFRPMATLHGSVSIASNLKKDDNSNGDKTVDFKGITFENMVLQTEAPKFSVSYFGYQGEQKLANFPVSLNEVGLRLKGEAAELVVDFSVNLTSENDGGNGGGCKLAIKAKLEDDSGRERWNYDGIDLERLNVKMEVAGLELEGAIFIFEDDPAYGKGFAGAVGAKFTMGMELDVEAKALFGRTDEFRYWFADAGVTLPTPIPIFTGFAINYFGGGFYNRMKMAGIDRSANGTFENIGTSVSGVIYEPSAQNNFGMKASVGIITQNSEDLFNATVELGMSFRRSGGLEEIYFKGEGNLISSIPNSFYDRLTEKLAILADGEDALVPAYRPEGRIAANVFIKHDFTNKVFHATSELYINLGFLKGIGDNGRAGWMDFYAARDTWHLLIGTPEDPIGTKMDLGILKEETRGYYMTGQDLPGSPPPPQMVAQLLGVDAAKLEYTRDLNKLDSGTGMAMGMHWAMTTGDLRFLIFYARFDAGFGFDIMLKDYGEAHCKGSSEQIGMDGWYANGQAYAYLQGKVGLKVKLFFKTKKIDIFSGSGAVLVQARLPNPVWLRGYFKGRYSVLGGLVKGSFRFKIELGDKCEVVGESALDGIVVIGDIVPKENASDIDVFSVPQVAFNLPINKVFELPDDEGDHRYKIMLDKFELSKGGNKLPGAIEWNDSNDSATFYSHEVLPPSSDLRAIVQLHFEEWINGRWEVIQNNGKPANEIKEVTFTTGVAPETIPLSNIEYMYPVLGQKNFFVKEYKTGYVKLKRGQSYLFDAVPGWKKEIVLKTTTEEKQEEFQYNAANKQLMYDLPKGVNTATDYLVQISLMPPDSESNSNVSESYSTRNLGNDSTGNDAEIRSRTIDQLSVNGEERELLSYEFRTSKYTTFQAKVNRMDKKQDLYRHLSPYELILQQDIVPDEPFDLVDLVGNRYSGNKPLVVAQAQLNNKYYKSYIYPLLYKEYPLADMIEVTRSTDGVGVPPVEAVEPVTSYITYLENGVFDTENFNPYSYNLTSYYYRDYLDLRYQLILKEDTSLLQEYPQLVSGTFPFMRKGDYRTKWNYKLPGQLQGQSGKTINYYNPLYE